MRAFSRSRPLTGSAWPPASATLGRAVRLSLSARASMRRSSSSARSGSGPPERRARSRLRAALPRPPRARSERDIVVRSEEHTSELQSPDHLVCRLLLEKKKLNAISTWDIWWEQLKREYLLIRP